MSLRRFFPGLLTGTTLVLAAACGSDSSSSPNALPVIGVSASAPSATRVTITFNSRAGDNSYNIERAEGSAMTFTQVGSVQAPSSPGPVTFADTGLQAQTLYRYRVITLVGTAQSVPSGEATVTTLAFGSAAAEIAADITANRTLSNDTTYTLKGFIHVTNGATLTIKPGTTIKGDFNTLGSSLFIMRGARIDAQGTADAPIVFTSSRPAGQRQPGDWGGLLIIGNAPINRTGSVEIEGSGTDGTTAVSGKNYQVLYSGGTTPTDNSGTLRYVRVEFAGYAPSLNTEFNAFTFAAIGSGTRASYLQSMAALDDAFEFFGGAFDADHLVAYETADDMFDMSEGFSGRLQYLIGFNSVQLTPRANAGFPATDLEGIENDGCNGSGCDNGFNQTPFTTPVVANFTLIGCGSVDCVGSAGGFGLMLRRGTGGYYVNGVVARFPRGGVSLRDAETFVRAGSLATPDLATADLAIRNVLFTDIGSAVFQTGTSPVQNSLDLTGNNLINSSTTAASLFTALPAQGVTPAGVSAFDWTPAATSAIATGGMANFSGKLATKAGAIVAPTSYLGAAAPTGAKWWAGWTVYFRN
jgi:hypothetical protein